MVRFFSFNYAKGNKMMKRLGLLVFCCAVLGACATNGGQGNTQMYGEISGGVESSKSF